MKFLILLVASLAVCSAVEVKKEKRGLLGLGEPLLDHGIENHGIDYGQYGSPLLTKSLASPLISSYSAPLLTKSYAEPILSAPIYSKQYIQQPIALSAPLYTKSYDAPLLTKSYTSGAHLLSSPYIQSAPILAGHIGHGAPIITKSYASPYLSAPAPLIAKSYATPLLTKAYSAPILAKSYGAPILSAQAPILSGPISYSSSLGLDHGLNLGYGKLIH